MAILPLTLMPGSKLLQAMPVTFKLSTHIRGDARRSCFAMVKGHALPIFSPRMIIASMPGVRVLLANCSSKSYIDQAGRSI